MNQLPAAMGAASSLELPYPGVSRCEYGQGNVMPRVTLYVPEDMHKRMHKRMNERPDVNWSAIFQAAVQAEFDKPKRDVIVLGSGGLKIESRHRVEQTT